MEITANYDDGSKRVVTDYTYSPNGALKVSDTKIVISYTSNGVTKTVKQKITVLAKNDNSNTNGSGGGYGSDDPATTNKQENKDNTTASGKMPQTGIEKTVLLGIAFVALIGTIGFVGYRRLSDI